MTTHTPPFCANSVMVADPANSTIVLMDTGNYPVVSNFLNDTWSFASGDWTNHSATLIDPAGPLPGRINFSMAYDGYNVTLFGGQGAASGQIFGDSWSWNGTSWSKLSPNTSPFGRFGAEATYLSATIPQQGEEVMVMFGGYGSSYLNETWVFEGSTGTKNWVQLNPTVSPSGRIGHCFAANTTACYMFSGQGSNSQFNDLWKFQYTYTNSAGPSGVWTQLTPATSPSVRSNACMAYDSGTGLLVMFGGENEYNYLPETWTYNISTNVWTQVVIANGTGPSGRTNAMMAYDTGSSRVIMFGGISATTGGPSNETWSFNSTSGVWTKL